MHLSQKISVLVADELPLLREGIGCLLRNSQQFVVSAAVSDGDAVLAAILEHSPMVAILDWGLPGLHPLEILRRVQQHGLPTRSILLAPRPERKLVMEALRAGASGFLQKNTPVAQLLDSITRVASGAIAVSPGLELEKVLHGRAGSRPDPLDTLSSREYQVFTLLIDGIRAKEIASRLSLSPKTVDTYRASLMRKLEIYDVAGLVKFAIHREITTVV